MKRGVYEHPKFLDLCASMKLRRYEVAGILEMLWHFTAKFTPRGDIGKYSNRAIAKFLNYRKNADSLIDCLIETGWLEHHSEHRLVVHDWEDHSDQTVARVLKNHDWTFVIPNASTVLADANGGASADSTILASRSRSRSLKPEPQPKPEPSPAGKPRPPDVIWDSLCAMFHLNPQTKSEKTRVGRVVRDLKVKAAVPADMPVRAAAYRKRFPEAALTPEALLKFWDELAQSVGQVGVSAEDARIWDAFIHAMPDHEQDKWAKAAKGTRRDGARLWWAKHSSGVTPQGDQQT